MILSGMSDDEQLEKNIQTFSDDRKLNDEELQTLLAVAEKMIAMGTVPCTACRYCVSHCPQELDIPRLISLYNEDKFTGGSFITIMALAILPEEKKPKSCLQCGSCMQVCPQQIRIPDLLAELAGKYS